MTNEVKILTPADLAALPPRPRHAHKGTFGRVLIIGGSHGMAGAAHLSAKAALRAGAGLVEILAPEENRIIHQTALPEALVTSFADAEDAARLLPEALSRASAVALGMGLGRGKAASLLTELTLATAKCPVVMDADALNAASLSPDIMATLYMRTEPTVLTPHMGEMSRLVGAPISDILLDPAKAAEALSRAAGVITVLKSAHTVISDGTALAKNTEAGNSGMATGGSGDVLAGVIAALLAAGAAPFSAACLGVLAHAMAGDDALSRCGNHGVMASDIADGLCRVLP